MKDSLRKEVQRALSTLTQREADVITLYFGLNGETCHDSRGDWREIQFD